MIDEGACARAFRAAAGHPRGYVPPPRRRPVSYVGTAACLAGVLLAGAGLARTARPAPEVGANVALVEDAADVPEPPDRPSPAAPARTSVAPASAPAPALPAAPVAAPPVPPAAPEPLVPATLSIPAARVRTSLERLRLDAAGELGTPRDYGRAGWWAGGVRPGARGAAVFVGHVDSTRGPAVFFRVPGLRPGDEVVVSDARGRALTFTVYRVERYPKSRFPTARVYGATAGPELRLITCGGAFDERTRHYRDNVVVYARR